MTAWVLPGPPEDSPDLIQPVVGYRAWGADNMLHSHGLGGLEWQPGVNRAECRLRQVRTVELGSVGITFRREAEDTSHDAPGGDCECGFYCMHSISGELLAWGQRGAAVGAVVVWGRVAVHREGMRAEYARIVALGLPDRAALSQGGAAVREKYERLAARYGVPLVPVVQLEEEALRHGIKLPEELLPEQPKRRKGGFTNEGREETFNQILKYTHGAHTRALKGWTNRRPAISMTPIREPVAFVNPWTIQTQTWIPPSAKTRRLRRSAIVAYLSGGSFLSMGVLVLGWSWTWLFSASALFAFAGLHLREAVKEA